MKQTVLFMIFIVCSALTANAHDYLAIVKSDNGQEYGFDTGYTREEAKSGAKRSCGLNGQSCTGAVLSIRKGCVYAHSPSVYYRLERKGYKISVSVASKRGNDNSGEVACKALNPGSTSCRRIFNYCHHEAK